MRILWIDPIVEDKFYVGALRRALDEARRPDTEVEIISLPAGAAPRHLRYHAYEALVMGEIVTAVYRRAADYDAFIIGCFYDLALREAREVSGKAIVTAPCESSIAIAAQLGNTFSVLVGAGQGDPKMRENIRAYGLGHRLMSMRPLNMGVLEFQSQAVANDGGDAARGGESGGRRPRRSHRARLQRRSRLSSQTLQDELGVPVIDSALAPFKYAEFLAETAQRFGWYPSRRWGSEPPPEDEIKAWDLF